MFSITKVGRRVDFSANPMYDPNFEFFDRKLLDDVRRNNENVHEFFRLMALCHTVMPEINDEGLHSEQTFFSRVILSSHFNRKA